MRSSIVEDQLHCEIDWELVKPGQPTEQSLKVTDKEFEEWVHSLATPAPRNRPAPQRQANAPKTGRALRRHQFAHMQGLYKKDRKRCAQEVLSGNWRTEKTAFVPLDEMEPAWREIMETPSLEDDRAPLAARPILWDLVTPVTSDDVRKVLKVMRKSSPGPDRLPYGVFKKIDPAALASHFDLWQYALTPPDLLSIGRAIFLEKVMNTARALEHRPITIASFIIRCYHKIIADRLERRLPFNVRQKGSMKGDGVAQNVWLLGSILSQCKEKLKPVSLCFIDVKKAFDSVNHQKLFTNPDGCVGLQLGEGWSQDQCRR